MHQWRAFSGFLCHRYGKFMLSKVSERAIALVNSDVILRFITPYKKVIDTCFKYSLFIWVQDLFPIVIKALLCNTYNVPGVFSSVSLFFINISASKSFKRFANRISSRKQVIIIFYLILVIERKIYFTFIYDYCN